jgi:hypothetical protein
MLYEIGFSWNSIKGLRTIRQSGNHQITGELTYIVTTGDPRKGEFISATEIEREIQRDERNCESLARALAKKSEEAILQAEHDSWYGFIESITLPTAKARALAALNKVSSIKDQMGERGALIKSLVDQGYSVGRASKSVMFSTNKTLPPTRILIGPEGNFFTEKDLTKTAIDFAEYLIRLNR